MTLPAGREYTDSALLEQLGGFLAYHSRGGGLSLIEWMDVKDFTASDRTFLEVAFMGATMDPAGLAT